MLESLLIPTITVALAEMGDKTQLLTLMLAARFRAPWPIIAGMAAATLLNHWLAALTGNWLAGFFSPTALAWLIALGFVLMALWVLIPDQLETQTSARFSYGPFLTTLVAFFLAEMGDKTQIATAVLAAQYPHFFLVVLGTTIGMLAVNAPVVLLGHFSAERLPLKLIRRLAAGLFIILASISIWQALQLSGTL